MPNPFQKAEPVAKKLKILLYGPSGSGKTIAALTFPRAAVIDTESGTDLYAGKPGIPDFSVLRVKTVAQVQEAMAFIRADKGKTFDTLVIDPISVVYDVAREATMLAARKSEMSFQLWGKLNQRMKALYIDLVDLPIHVVGTTRQATEYEGNGDTLRKVGAKPDADKTILYPFDFVIELANDHSGIVKKSRGVALGPSLPEVNWSIFEPIAAGFAQGKTIQQEQETDAQATEAAAIQDDLTNYEAAQDFVKHWNGQSITNTEILNALGVTKISQWKHGRIAADEQINAWIDEQMSKKKSKQEEIPA